MNEFDLIAKYLSPLCEPKISLNLTDDAAIIPGANDTDLVITKDALTEGVHFLTGTPAKYLASKALRVNLSDIAAMGATPKYYLIAGILPKDTDEKWFKEFTSTLEKEQELFGINLIGGDTVKHNGPTSISITMIGEVPKNSALKRSGAKSGDAIFVSGTLGEAALGLLSFENKLVDVDDEAIDVFRSRYQIPEPRVKLGKSLQGLANSAIDISDGLIADLSHICECSEVSAVIFKEQIPISNTTRKLIDKDDSLFKFIATGGDDYELLFTINPNRENEILALAAKMSIKLTKIGRIDNKTASHSSVELLDTNGKKVNFNKTGYSHF